MGAHPEESEKAPGKSEPDLLTMVRDLQGAVRAALERCAVVGFFSVAKEVQQETRDSVKSLGGRVGAAKAHAISQQDEDRANLLLSLVFTVRSLHSELSMWIALKEERFEFAWERLVAAQELAQAAMRSHRGAFNLAGYLRKLLALEALLFPPQIFFSIGAIFESVKCSICGEEYGDCNHLSGMPYMGKMCCEMMLRAKKIEEYSIVDDPADKRCRAISHEQNGRKIDMLTRKALAPEHMDDASGDKEKSNSVFVEGYIVRFDAENDPFPED